MTSVGKSCAAIAILRFFLSILCCGQIKIVCNCWEIRKGSLLLQTSTELTCSWKERKIEDLFWGKGEEGNLSRGQQISGKSDTHSRKCSHSLRVLGNFRLKLISQESEVGNLKREAETRLQLLLEANDALEVP